jgi:preprotein translocase subunit SecA
MSTSLLHAVLDQRAELRGADPAVPERVLWLGGDVAAAAPMTRLSVLQSHGVQSPVSTLDRWGHAVQRVWRRLHRPVLVLRRRAEGVVEASQAHRPLSDEALRLQLMAQSQICRRALASERQLVDSAALAGVMVAVERVHGFQPHVEQIMGALALLDGDMAEMATGEGKTITAAMAAIVAAWRGRPCHVVTANDYLARRDAELGQPLFAFCHVSAASVHGEVPPQTRGAAYSHDIVYATARELLGDHLRDGLALGKTPSRTRFALNAARQEGRVGSDGVVMRGIDQVIVDEADSVLIDEAVTPLIISAQRPDDFLEQAAQEAVRLARGLRKDEHFRIQAALRHVELTPLGQEVLHTMTHGLQPFWQQRARTRELVEMALYALHILVRDQHFVVEEDKIILVDELTGRLADQRTLSLGMQQILEATQGLPLSPPSEVSARLSFQRFFRLFQRLGGMTGTAQEARGEFASVYRLFTLKIPTHRPVIRETWPTCLLADEDTKLRAIADSALALTDAGRAVLIGMRSVASSEALHRVVMAMRPQAVVHVLHAVHHAQESAIVARAGQPGALTIATNMAGRGTDIALDEQVREQGGLHVILGEANDYGRIDRQLMGRCARQGDPGSVQRFLSLDEDVVRRFVPRWLREGWGWLYQRHPAWALRWSPQVLALAQARAQQQAFRQRRAILRQDIELDRGGF